MHRTDRKTAPRRPPVRGLPGRLPALLLLAVLVLAACEPAEELEDEAAPADEADAGAEAETDADAEAEAEAEPEDEPAEDDGELTSFTAAIPFPGGIPFYPMLVAEDRGYLEDEGLELEGVEALDGSGALLQQLLSGQIEVGLPSPGPLMSAVEEGADLVSIYTLYQSNVFALVVLEDSEVTELADLEGGTIGVDSPDAGGPSLARAVLFEEEGLEEGEDYDMLSVGDGGTAAVALERGEVDAYAASFADVAIMRLRGLELRDILPADYQELFDSLVVVQRDLVEEDPDFAIGLGRALAKATEWGRDNPGGVLEITSGYFPEEAEDEEFALALLEETQSLYELPEGAEGWGYHVPETVDLYMNYLVEQGFLEGPIDRDVFLNDHVDQYQDFDEADL